ncbi:hypothetical protein PVK06_034057 [Gossypium arboreum]|uniref:Reverse transcriptase domain-containing protein n=1 Tax=Gossypium arboreum TaxID=29729 RepID=A0ABR0ND27_GOSAR|nr:hypothetical protein PVK06_034057 [Gossypium arboreum]
MEMVRQKCGFYNGIDIGAAGSKGGLSLGWKGNDLVSVRSYSSFYVDADIHDPDNGETWRLTGFYGNPDERFRWDSWNLLHFLGHDCAVPWLVFGDFNEITSSFEKKGRRLRPEGQMAEFRFSLEDCSLHDIGFNGRWFTWERGRFSSTNIRERLDRGVASLNTSFFHKAAVAHHTRNQILGLEDESGKWVSDPEELLRVAVKYFGDLFTTSASGANDRVLDLVENRISDEMNENLLKPFTKEDIWCTVKSISPLKAPGIDGYPALFYQWYWHIVGDDVSHFCLEVLNGRIVMEEINRTHLVLFPKVDKPKNMAQFRPISLCNILYKIIAKVIVDRMSLFLGFCIDEAQGAFISGRQISDNTLIAYEVLHALKIKKRDKKGNFALKLDLSKAYDRVEWYFLAEMLTRLGFHQDWVVLIMRCVCSVTYTVGINESKSECFVPSRGLCQGDPLSPYLFLICAEGLSCLLNEAKAKNCLKENYQLLICYLWMIVLFLETPRMRELTLFVTSFENMRLSRGKKLIWKSRSFSSALMLKRMLRIQLLAFWV